MARTGRRPGPSTTREAILAAARHRFADDGYDLTSVRVVAADAGVDPGLVLHFFGSKDGLFQAAVGWPFDPARLTSRLFEPGTESIGARLARTFLDLWEEPATRAAFTAVLRSAATHPGSAALVREFISHQLVTQLTGRADTPQAVLRLNLAMSQLVGVAILRHIVQVEPIASVSTDVLVRLLTPSLDHYLSSDADIGEK
jgi:AcrR family transcriptional regulator